PYAVEEAGGLVVVDDHRTPTAEVARRLPLVVGGAVSRRGFPEEDRWTAGGAEGRQARERIAVVAEEERPPGNPGHERADRAAEPVPVDDVVETRSAELGGVPPREVDDARA